MHGHGYWFADCHGWRIGPFDQEIPVGQQPLSAQSLAEIPKILAVDAITAPSTVTIGPDLKSIRGYAKRPDAEQAASAFEDLATAEMARAAALLALSWDEIYVAAGRPDLGKYRAFQYLFEPRFVKPDYLK